MTHVQVGVDQHGLRGLYAMQPIAEGEPFFAVPESAIINTGSTDGDILHAVLSLLREVHTPCSRFKPYLATFPPPKSAVNACLIPMDNVKLLQSPYWEGHVALWQRFLRTAWEERLTQQIAYTFRDMLGNVDVTLDEVMDACALVTTRYVQNGRSRLVLAPIFDLSNHRPHCPHKLEVSAEGGTLYLVAGRDVEEGEEVCYSYGSEMRDDYAAFYYGFLPEQRDPPKLLTVDHPAFNGTEYSPAGVPDEDFTGTREEMQDEVSRLSGILAELEAFEVPPPPAHDPEAAEADGSRELMLELRRRRVLALKYEISRLQVLSDKEEL